MTQKASISVASQQVKNQRLAVEFTTHGAEETQALGRTIGLSIHDNLVIALHGDLGTGKTTLTQGIARGLDIEDRVTSPSFTLVNEYRGRNGARLFHVDSYRLADSSQEAILEAGTFGMEEMLAELEDAGAMDSPGPLVIVIEWAERLINLLPEDHLEINIDYGAGSPDERQFQLVARGPVSADVVHRIAGGLSHQSPTGSDAL